MPAAEDINLFVSQEQWNEPDHDGFGDLVLKDRERIQPRAGRFDPLLQDVETNFHQLHAYCMRHPRCGSSQTIQPMVTVRCALETVPLLGNTQSGGPDRCSDITHLIGSNLAT